MALLACRPRDQATAGGIWYWAGAGGFLSRCCSGTGNRPPAVPAGPGHGTTHRATGLPEGRFRLPAARQPNAPVLGADLPAWQTPRTVTLLAASCPAVTLARGTGLRLYLLASGHGIRPPWSPAHLKAAPGPLLPASGGTALHLVIVWLDTTPRFWRPTAIALTEGAFVGLVGIWYMPANCCPPETESIRFGSGCCPLSVTGRYWQRKC